MYKKCPVTDLDHFGQKVFDDFKIPVRFPEIIPVSHTGTDDPRTRPKNPKNDMNKNEL